MVVLQVGAERIEERISTSGERVVRYRLLVPEGMSKELEALREQVANGGGFLLAELAGDVFFTTDVVLEDFGLRGDRRVVELDALWSGTPGSHYMAYELSPEALENYWGI